MLQATINFNVKHSSIRKNFSALGDLCDLVGLVVYLQFMWVKPILEGIVLGLALVYPYNY